MFQVAYGKMFEKYLGVEFRTISAWEGDVIFKNGKIKLIKNKKFREKLIKYGRKATDHSNEDWVKIFQIYNEEQNDDIKFIYPHDVDSWKKPETSLALDCGCWDSEYIFSQYNKKDFSYNRL